MKRSVKTLGLVLLFIMVACGPRQQATQPPVPSPQEAAPKEQSRSPDPDRKFAFADYPKSVTPESQCTILENTAYVACYSELRKAPLWVAYTLIKVDPMPGLNKRLSRFKVDERTESKVSHDDYTDSGYDRGHMAPFAAIDRMYGKEAGAETFLMSNVVPQKPGLKKGHWRALEEATFEGAIQHGQAWVITGPFYDEEIERIESGVEIPDGFYKIYIHQESLSKFDISHVVIDHDTYNQKLNFGLPWDLEDLEQATGLDFPAEMEGS